jgi:hypothetical protein
VTTGVKTLRNFGKNTLSTASTDAPQSNIPIINGMPPILPARISGERKPKAGSSDRQQARPDRANSPRLKLSSQCQR